LWVLQYGVSLLEAFLFGVKRTASLAYAERFYQLKDGRYFYRRDRLTGSRSGEVDYSILWSR
jgi:hypothetical protein